jgi:hypothetical protein
VTAANTGLAPPPAFRIQPPALVPEIFDQTMAGLEAGLQVEDVATFELLSCQRGDEVAEVLQRDDLAQFDAIPVVDDGRMVAVIERLGPPRSHQGRVRQLDDAILVGAREPLKTFIPRLADERYRLVVRNSRIEGIVTRSDVHKLPARLLVFALVTHLEMSMAAVVTREFASNSWVNLLPKKRRERVYGKFERLESGRLDPDMIEVTEFSDKRTILARKGLLGDRRARDRAVAELTRVERLRHKVAHAATFARDDEEFSDFVEVLDLTERWIVTLAEKINAPRP